MNSKRIILNINLYKKIWDVEKEYSDKLLSKLSELLIQPNLSFDEWDIKYISGCMVIHNLDSSMWSYREYSDRNRDDYRNCLYSFYVLHGRENVWKYISSMYEEGINKINELAKQILPPKKILKFNNFETQEEYEKVYYRYVFNYCEGIIEDRKILDELIESMEKRAITLGLKTMKEIIANEKE